jgi:hypothetical protein
METFSPSTGALFSHDGHVLLLIIASRSPVNADAPALAKQSGASIHAAIPSVEALACECVRRRFERRAGARPETVIPVRLLTCNSPFEMVLVRVIVVARWIPKPEGIAITSHFLLQLAPPITSALTLHIRYQSLQCPPTRTRAPALSRYKETSLRKFVNFAQGRTPLGRRSMNAVRTTPVQAPFPWRRFSLSRS